MKLGSVAAACALVSKAMLIELEQKNDRGPSAWTQSGGNGHGP